MDWGRSDGSHKVPILYKILKTKEGGYDGLIETLNESMQKATMDFLQRGNSNHVLAASTGSHVKTLLGMPVEIAGSVKILQEAFPSVSHSDARELLDHKEIKQEMVQLLQNSVPLKLQEIVPQPARFYIPRLISNRPALNQDIFRLDCPDVFVFKGVERNELVKLVHPHVTRSSNTQQFALTSRHIYLDDDNDWEALKLVTKTPMHLVQKVNDHYILQCSTQVTRTLVDSVVGKIPSNVKFMHEDDFVDLMTFKSDTQLFIVCDLPGMGKTLLMDGIAHKIQQKSFKTVVIKIKPRQIVTQLKELNKFNESSAVLYLILEITCKSPLAAHLLQKISDRNEIKIIFFLDGLEEINQNFVEPNVSFLKLLIRNRNVQLIISSRLHMRTFLETTFNSISYKILPFAREQQVQCVVGHWCEKDSEAIPSN